VQAKDIRSFITSYLAATESNTPRTRVAFCDSSTVWKTEMGYRSFFGRLQ